ncbi:hypothetical protein ACFL3A_04535 [Pseudomonadota bacterium]
MIQIQSAADIKKLSPHDPAYPIVKELVEQLIEGYTWEGHPYNPDDYGYIILIEPKDVDRELDELWDGCRLTNIYWEGIFLRDDGFFVAIYLANNEYGLTFVIPDAEWVNGELRSMIEDILDP